MYYNYVIVNFYVYPSFEMEMSCLFKIIWRICFMSNDLEFEMLPKVLKKADNDMKYSAALYFKSHHG